jgi:hypothetical protein
VRVLIAAVVLAVIGVVAGIATRSPSPPARPRFLESIAQDDEHLLNAPGATVAATLDRLKALGIDVVRVTVQWRLLAPAPDRSAPPAGFDPASPADYRSAAWARYDRVVELARARDMAVDLDLTGPGPLWAMARGAPNPSLADRWYPGAVAFGEFVTAVGRRYSGRFVPTGGSRPLPRVDFWSIWDEPNQPEQLAPQWRPVGAGQAMESPELYRAYVGAAFGALAASGHGPSTDTILVGELAGEGCEQASGCPYERYDSAIAPIPFVRALYCVNAHDQPLTGATASALGCTITGSREEFVLANPGLFGETGFAVHPYASTQPPSAIERDRSFVALSELSRLERELDSIFRSYGVARRLPLYVTQYGYETNPPDPFDGVSPQLQAGYLDEAAYIAWRDPRVRAMSQFLLYDSSPDGRYRAGTPGYWSTSQTGLLFADGAAKLSLAAYRLPVFIPVPELGPHGTVRVWAMLRPAPRRGLQRAQIQWAAAGGSFRTVTDVRSRGPNHVVLDAVRVPGPGRIRVAWRPPGGDWFYSRVVEIHGG